MHTYSDGKKIYIVDMMIAYANIYKHPVMKFNIEDFKYVLDAKVWGSVKKGYSPNDVLKNKKKYKDEIKRIQNANLKYPIIINDKHIVDGYHRLTKAYLNNNKTINVIYFNENLMKNFLIESKGNWKKVNDIQYYEMIKLFFDRFCI